MADTVTIPPITITGTYTSKRDLTFFIAATGVGGALEPFDYNLIVEYDGQEYDVYVLDKPDAAGRLQVPGVNLPRNKGSLVISARHGGWSTTLQERYNIMPFVIGRCHYSLAVHGRLLFNVTPEVAAGGSTSTAQADGTTKSDPTVGVTGTVSVAPGGVGGSVSGSVTRPGDTSSTTRTGTEVTNVTSVRELKVEQIAVRK